MHDDDDDAPAKPRPPRHLRWLLRALFWLSCAATALVAAVVFVVVNAVEIVDQNLDRLLPLASAHLQRPLHIAAIRGSIFPRVDVVIDGLELGSGTSAPPLVLLGSIEIGFRLDELVRTRGEALLTDVVHINGGVVRVVRNVDGSFDLADVLARLPPLDPDDIQGAVLGDIVVDHVAVDYIDEVELRLLQARRLHVEADGVGLGRPFDAMASFIWRGPNTPVTFTAHADEVPTDLVLWPLPASTFNLTTGNIPLAELSDLAATPIFFERGAVALDVTADVVPGQPVQLVLDVVGEGTSPPVRSGTGAGIERASVTRPLVLRGVVEHDLDRGETHVVEARAAIVGVQATARAWLTPAGLQEAEAHVDVEQLARLGLLVPPLLSTSRGAFVVAGAASGDVRVMGNRFAGDFDFHRARIEIGEALQKPANAPLHVDVDGCRGGACGTVQAGLRFALQHGTVIAGTLLVPAAAGADTVLDLRSNTVALSEASAISPLINDIFGTTQRGQLQAHAVGHIGARRTMFDIDIDLSALDLRYATTAATGAATLHFDVDTDRRGLALGVQADASALAVTTIDDQGAVLFSKRTRSLCLVSAQLREVGGPGALGQAMAGQERNGIVFDNDHLAPRWQTIMAGLEGGASVRVSSIDLAAVAMQQVQLDVSLRQGRLSISDSAVRVMGGLVHLRKSSVDVTDAPVHWTIDVEARGLSASQLLAPARRFTGAVRGTIDATAKLSARGLSIAPLLQSLSGPLSVSTRGVHLARLDLVSSWLDGFWTTLDRLPWVDHEAVARMRRELPSAAIADATWSIRFVRDQFRFSEPVLLDTALGALGISGAAGFDGSIHLDAQLALDNEQLTQLEVIAAERPLPLRIHVDGTWMAPAWHAENFDVLRASVVARTRRAVVDASRAVRDAAQEIQDRVNMDIDATVRRTDEQLGQDPRTHAPAPAPAPADDGDAGTSPTHLPQCGADVVGRSARQCK